MGGKNDKVRFILKERANGTLYIGLEDSSNIIIYSNDQSVTTMSLPVPQVQPQTAVLANDDTLLCIGCKQGYFFAYDISTPTAPLLVNNEQVDINNGFHIFTIVTMPDGFLMCAGVSTRLIIVDTSLMPPTF